MSVIEISPSIVKPIIAEKIRYSLQQNVDEESQVILHCKYDAIEAGDKIRIWKSTFLYAKESDHISNLINVQKITIYPQWTLVELGKSFSFTLIFSSLPKSCKYFDLIEEIPEPGGFFIENIKRNQLDIYNINI